MEARELVPSSATSVPSAFQVVFFDLSQPRSRVRRTTIHPKPKKRSSTRSPDISRSDQGPSEKIGVIRDQSFCDRRNFTEIPEEPKKNASVSKLLLLASIGTIPLAHHILTIKM
jgi:hypothetical protein